VTPSAVRFRELPGNRPDRVLLPPHRLDGVSFLRGDLGAQHLPAAPTPAYVAWLDVIGAKGAMLRSLPVAANFVFMLHVTALEDYANFPVLRLYPVMDGSAERFFVK